VIKRYTMCNDGPYFEEDEPGKCFFEGGELMVLASDYDALLKEKEALAERVDTFEQDALSRYT
jgi:hypothetical protein